MYPKGYDCAPGNNEELYELLKLRLDSYEDIDKNLSMCFDEMAVSNKASYNKHLRQTFPSNCGKVQVAQLREAIQITQYKRQCKYRYFSSYKNYHKSQDLCLLRPSSLILTRCHRFWVGG